ncbi:MAG TPA: hypothetical protein VK550_12235 [Polyangiaceae bacterium]|nr:hypothetical protein [Polyangiaceae bacterium]
MSWSIDVVGTKSDVVEEVTEQLDKIAASYDGKEEGKDVVAVKERILSIVEAMEVDESAGDDEKATPTKADEKAPTKAPKPTKARGEELAIYVKANGSHGWSDDKIVVANLTMRIGRTTRASG